MVNAPSEVDLQPMLRHLRRDETLLGCIRRIFVLEPRRCWTLKEGIAHLSDLISAEARDGVDCAVKVQVHPRYLEARVVEELTKRGCKCDTKGFTHIASIVVADACCAYGLTTRHATRAGDDEGVDITRALDRPKDGSEHVSRAYWKLQEVLLRSGWRDELQSTRPARALDIGASPGGWSANLASGCAWRCREVIAVDPGELAPGVLATPSTDDRGSVRHLRMGWKEALETLQSEGGHVFDALVCDANIPCDQALDMMESFSAMLSENAYIVLTFKNCSRTKAEFQSLKQQQMERLRASCADIREVFLLANKQLETTCLARFIGCRLRSSAATALGQKLGATVSPLATGASTQVARVA
eukprot:TRINITY_DN7418_c0_g2_i2.p1 TRINITY_DN7418_c0_g2~~TRINITY_DN7418_c0_g2_i2.p1  ORF type:complete len:358 (+),score=68.89 TRINITY_DN7418_c0_g2_i2:665-1738(+)